MKTISPQQWNAFCADPSGDRFQPIYDATRGLVYTLCRRVLTDPDDALEAFQSTYTRLLLHARHPEPDFPQGDLVRMVGRLALREAWRLEKRRSRRGRKELAVDRLPLTPDPGLPPREQAARQQLREQLETLIRVLPEPERLPVQLHYLNGMTQEAIAEVLEVNKSTVSRRIERGLRHLQPLVRRAGLGDSLALLAPLAVAAALIEPPTALAAGVVLAQAHAGASALAAAGESVSALSTATKTVGGGIMKAKTASWTAFAALVLLGVATVGIVYWDGDANREVSREVRQAAGAASPTTESVTQEPTSTTDRTGNEAAPPSNTSNSSESSDNTDADATDTSPSGPMRAFTVHALWKDTQTRAAGTSVTLIARHNGGPPRPVFSGATDEQGNLRAEFPESADELSVHASQPLSARWDAGFKKISNSGLNVTDPLIVELERGGRIFGSILDARDRKPVSRAHVMVLQIAGADRRPVGDVVADTDGRYNAAHLPEATYTFEARTETLFSDPRDPASQPVALAVGSEYGPLDILLYPGGSVTGVVTDLETGSPLAGAVVLAQVDRRLETTTDAEGRYRLQALPLGRTLQLAAQRSGYVREPRLIELRPEIDAQADFALEPGGRILVHVTDENGDPVPGASVRIDDGLMRYSTANTHLKTDAGGEALIVDVSRMSPPRIDVDKTDYVSPPMQLKPDFSAGRETRLDVSLYSKEAVAGTYVGVVTDPDGKPIPGVTVAYTNTSFESVRDKTQTGPDGQYRLRPKQAFQTAYLCAVGEGWSTRSVPAPQPSGPDETITIDLTLEPGHWLAGRVVDEKDEPLRGASISLNASVGGLSTYFWPKDQRDARTDADGRFRIVDLPGARMRVSAQADGYPSKDVETEIDREVAIALKPYGKIDGRVVDAETGEPVSHFSVRLRQANGWDDRMEMAQSFSDPEGRFSLHRLDRDESYQVTVSGKEYADKVEDGITPIPDDASKPKAQVFEMRRGGAVAVQFVDAKSFAPIQGAVAYYGLINPGRSMSVLSRPDNAADWAQLMGVATADAEGRAEFIEGDRPLTLVIVARGYGRDAITPGDRRKFRRGDDLFVIPMTPGASIRGTALVDGSPTPDTSLYLSTSGHAGHSFNLDARSDVRGQFAFEDVPPGDCEIALQRQFGRVGITALSKRFALAGGEEREENIGDDLGEGALFGQVLKSGAPVANAQVSLQPLFDSNYTRFGYVSDKDGVYRLNGLRPGRYRASINAVDDPHFRTIQRVVDVDGVTEHDFELEYGYRVTARLVFPDRTPPEMASKFRRAYLLNLSRAMRIDQTNEPDAIEPQVEGTVADGIASFRGRMRGNYRLALAWGETPGSLRQIQIDREFPIDNLEQDIDLGDVEVPMFGRMSLAVTFEGGAPSGQNPLAVVVYPVGRPEAFSMMTIDKSKPVQTLGGVPIGDIEVAAFAPAYETIPKTTAVTITSDGEPSVAVTVKRSTWFQCQVQGEVDGIQVETPLHLTVSGPGGTFDIAAEPLDPSKMIRFMFSDAKTFAMGPMFVIRNVEPGTYALTIEADGYETFRKAIDLPLGEARSDNISLKKIAAP